MAKIIKWTSRGPRVEDIDIPDNYVLVIGDQFSDEKGTVMEVINLGKEITQFTWRTINYKEQIDAPIHECCSDEFWTIINAAFLKPISFKIVNGLPVGKVIC